MNNNVFCTIFTPTYNRKHLIKKLYDSLCKQEIKNFEWIVIDDGSIDGTEELFKILCEKENDFNIIYKRKENGGKHRAINYGIDYANGEVVAIVDSDDYLTPNATKKIKEYFDDISMNNTNNIKFAGVAANKCYKDNKMIGTTFDGNVIDAKSTERKSNNIDGDKFEIYYTKILKENKFPEIDGEKFMTEAILWTRIASKGYYLRWHNDNIYVCEYLEGGLTDSRDKLIKNSPKGYALYIIEQKKYGKITLKQKLGYYSFYYKIRKESANIKTVAKELKTNLFVIYVAYTIRKIIEKVRNINEKKEQKKVKDV